MTIKLTREEAIRTLRKVKGEVMRGSYIDEVYDMAIEALQKPPISQRSMYQAGYRQGREETLKQVTGKLNNPDDSLLTADSEACKEQKSKLDLISRTEAIEAIEIVDWYHQNSNKDMVSGANSDEHQAWYKAQDIYKALEAVPSADRPRGEQYKKGFEDAKRAFLVEYARESENMRKRNAQLEVRLNAQKAISADRPRWTPCAERMPDDGKWAIWCSNEGAIGIARFKEDCYNHFYPNGTSFGLEDAVAWMPLPEPYKESDTE